MATKDEVIRALKVISPNYELDYVNDGESTEAVLKATPDRPWANTGSIKDVHVYYEMGTPKSRFWDDVLDQIETSTQVDIPR